MSRSTRPPSYRRHSSGQARVTINGRDCLLGPYNSAASKEAYRRLIAEWAANPASAVLRPQDDAEPLSISELILAYWKHACKHYGFDHKPGRGDYYCHRDALKVVRLLYSRTAAIDFGPLALKACRQKMIELDWSRKYVNAQTDRIRRMFRWAAEEELLPGSVYADLRAVASLRQGKTDARETQKIKPVPQEHIDAALPFMPVVVQAMVRFELLTGCRPAEVCRVRPIDIDRSDPTCWIYRPGSDGGEHGEHKTAHHGHDRLIFIGPKGQEVLLPYLARESTSFCFRPADAVAERNAKRRQQRQTPLWASHLKHMAAKRKAKPKRVPGECYNTRSYNHAIARACRKASVPSWSPNQLRHNRATELRRHGLDVTKTVLGHAKVETSQIYAEKDLERARKLMAEIG